MWVVGEDMVVEDMWVVVEEDMVVEDMLVAGD